MERESTRLRRYCLLPPLCPLQVNLKWRAALRALAGLVCLHRLRLRERHVELEGLVLGVPALGALGAQPHDHRDSFVHGRGISNRGNENAARMIRQTRDARTLRVSASKRSMIDATLPIA